MRTNLKQFLVRLASIVLITIGLNARLSAHDLPADRSLPETATVYCFTFTSSPAVASPHTATNSAEINSVKSLLVIVPPDAGVAPRPKSKALPAATVQIQSLLDSTSFEHQSLLVISLPDAGVAPRPRSRVHPAAKAQTQPAIAGEIYMPYDFRMSDWRFGQFPYHGKTASAPRPTTLPLLASGVSSVPSLLAPNIAEIKSAPPTRQCVALGNFLQQFEQFQSSTYAALSNGQALTVLVVNAGLVDNIAESLERFATAGRRGLLAGEPASDAAPSQLTIGQPASPFNDLSGPQFVVYGSTVGEHIVLTLAQARDWQFEMPLGQVRSAGESRLKELLNAGLNPIQTRLLATASGGLRHAGQTLLNLSQSLSSISQPRVASGSPAQQR